MRFEIVYARAESQQLLTVEREYLLTVEQAIIESGILLHYPEIDLMENPVGIFGRQVELSTLLEDGDRVEIYRPLRVDPKEMRRNRLEAQGESRRFKKQKPSQNRS